MTRSEREAFGALIASDRARLVAHIRAQSGADPVLLCLHPGWIAVRLHRAAHRAWTRDQRKRARLIYQLGCLLTGSDIHPNARIGPGLLIGSPCGVNISGVAGADATFMPRAGMGIIQSQRDVGAGPGLPVLGDRVLVGSSGGPLGAVRFGHGSMLGPRCFRSRDVPQGLTAERAIPCQVQPRGERASRQVTLREPSPTAERACDHRTLAGTMRAIRADLERHHHERTGVPGPVSAGARLSALLSNVCLQLTLHRVAHWLWTRGLTAPAALLGTAGRWIFKSTIDPSACIGGGCFLPHPAGVLIRGRVGPRLTVYADGIIASERPDSPPPRIGEGLIVGGQAMVVGDLRVGDRARIAATVTLDTDLPSDATAMSDVIRFRERPRLFGPGEHACAPEPLRAPRRALRTADRQRLLKVMGRSGMWAALTQRCSPGNVAVSLFRIAEAAHARGRPGFAQFVRQLNMLLTGADLDPRSRIGPGLVIPYPAGVSLYARAGRDLTIMALAGVDADPEREPSPATIGDRVTLGHHSLVWGPVRIGSDAEIEPGALAGMDVVSDHHDGGMCVRTPDVRVRGGEA